MSGQAGLRVFAATAIACCGCELVAGLEDTRLPSETAATGGQSGSDASIDSPGVSPRGDSGTADSSAWQERDSSDDEADEPRDAHVDPASEAGLGTEWNALQDLDNWEHFSRLTASSCEGYFGGTFDGRYVYFIPASNKSPMLRYDTHGDFSAPASWSFVTVYAAIAFHGGLLSNGYVYLVPSAANGSVGPVLRFRPGQFNDSFHWETSSAGGSDFWGAATVGNFVYFGAVHKDSERYDTTESFADFGSWTGFTTTSCGAAVSGFRGVLAVNDHLYYVPYETRTLLEYRIASDKFNDTAGWSPAQVSGSDGTRAGFIGAVTDGTFLYLVPNNNGQSGFDGYFGKTVRYDATNADVVAAPASAWVSVDLPVILGNADARGFQTGAFDGRHIYYAPYRKSVGELNGLVVRHDTTRPTKFESAESWEAFDVASAGVTPTTGFAGAVFDGEYVYFVPATGCMVTRFHARSSRMDLPAFYPGGSFL